MLKKITIIILLIFFNYPILFSQNRDIIAKVRIENITLLKPDSLQFDVRLYRLSDIWSHWANGTFQFNLLSENEITHPDSINISLVPNTTELTQKSFPGFIPTESYYITPRIFEGRISISVAGPELFEDSDFVPLDSGIRIGTFLVSSKKSDLVLPELFNWKMPQYFWQATAFKVEIEYKDEKGNIWAFENDNMEMHDDYGFNTVVYEVENLPAPEMILEYFEAEYIGQKQVALEWATIQEAYNKGFVLERGIVPLSTADTTDVDYTDLVARYDGTGPHDPGLVGLGTRRTGKKYTVHYDTIPYRGVEYCYLLRYVDFNDQIRELPYTDPLGIYHERAIVCVPAPNAVITYAQANPNPFREKTEVEYIVEDDVYLTCKVYNVLGQEVVTLIDNELVRIGKHTVTFGAPDGEDSYASQGLYDIIFIATPINDKYVEVSRAVVKVQLIR